MVEALKRYLKKKRLRTKSREFKELKDPYSLFLFSFSFLLFVLFHWIGCTTVGPNYQRPSLLLSDSFKEIRLKSPSEKDRWKSAEPQDEQIHADWWLIFGDTELNKLEAQVKTQNQSILGAVASFHQAKALLKEAQAQYSPTFNISPSINFLAQAHQLGASSQPLLQYTAPLTASWVPDFWGRISNLVKQQSALVQLSAADLENMKLTQHTLLAMNYYQLKAQDEFIELLDKTVKAYQSTLELTQTLFATGIASAENMAQAETQLKATQSQRLNLEIARANYEHAIAVLIGESPSVFSVQRQTLKEKVPVIPLSIPSLLLERRPDIASAERAMAAANAQIGIAASAFYPNVTLTGGVGGFGSSERGLFELPLLFWSVGASLVETLVDGGLRSATVEQYQGRFEQTVANYRQTVLSAFQQVEDNLAALRILSEQEIQQNLAVKSAEKTLRLAVQRYQTGLDPYLNVLTAQVSLLGNQQAQIRIRLNQFLASIQLIEALGGGWDSSELTPEKILKNSPQSRNRGPYYY